MLEERWHGTRWISSNNTRDYHCGKLTLCMRLKTCVCYWVENTHVGNDKDCLLTRVCSKRDWMNKWFLRYVRNANSVRPWAKREQNYMYIYRVNNKKKSYLRRKKKRYFPALPQLCRRTLARVSCLAAVNNKRLDSIESLNKQLPNVNTCWVAD